MAAGCTDYGDYDGEFDVCAKCGQIVVDSRASLCKVCAQRQDADRREQVTLERKLGRHRVHKWWTQTALDAELAAFECCLRWQTAHAVQDARAA